MKKIISLLILIVFSCANLSAQQIGSWRMHFATTVSKHLAYSNDKILSATNESIVLYDKENNNEIRNLDKSNALSDIGISGLAYCKDEETFIIAYNSTNIDLLTNDLVLTNIPDLKNKITSVSKNINNILIDGSKAFFSTDLGIVVLDIPNQEIDNTFIIGNGGNSVSVLDCAIINDTIYALTDGEGVKSAPIEGLNLLDFSNWKLNVNMPSGLVNFLEVYNNELYAVTDLTKLHKKDGQIWNELYSDNTITFKSLEASEKLVSIFKQDSLGTTLKDRFIIIDNSGGIDTVVSVFTTTTKLGVFQNETDFYLGDISQGLYDYTKRKTINPSGKPYKSNIYSFSNNGNKVFAAPGTMTKGIVAGFNNDGFYYFEDNAWKNVNEFSAPGIEKTMNFVDVQENPYTNIVYGATTEGLVEYNYNTITIYDSTNSLIQKQFAGGTHQYITGIGYDLQGNVWMVNSQTTEPLIILTRSGEWHQYPLSFGGNLKYHHLFVDSRSQKWVSLRGKGISVFPSIEDLSANHNGAAISITIGSGLPNDNVNCITEDKKGRMWIGTDEGIATFSCAESIFDGTTDCNIADPPIKSTLDQYTEYLFDTDQVNSISVDGANRKWVGTNSGAYLLSESGDEVLLSFNTENSPLPSNEVISIGIQEQTGEVFIGTPFGIASYVSDATEPFEDISNIKAFPNPVSADYNGTISVTGLVENSFVKITDINGVLIHDGYALGGKFVWDGKSYNGIRARSGVYLVFSSDNKSKNKAVAKIVFIN